MNNTKAHTLLERIAVVRVPAWDQSIGIDGAEAILAALPDIAAAPETAAERDRLKEINAELLAAIRLARMHIANTLLDHVIVSLDHPDVRLGEYLDNAIAKATGDQT